MSYCSSWAQWRLVKTKPRHLLCKRTQKSWEYKAMDVMTGPAWTGECSCFPGTLASAEKVPTKHLRQPAFHCRGKVSRRASNIGIACQPKHIKCLRWSAKPAK